MKAAQARRGQRHDSERHDSQHTVRDTGHRTFNFFLAERSAVFPGEQFLHAIGRDDAGVLWIQGLRAEGR